MAPNRRAVMKFHLAVVLTILALLISYLAFIWFVFSEVTDRVFAQYGFGDVWAMLALGILFLLMVEGFVTLAKTVPSRVARYVAIREGLAED